MSGMFRSFFSFGRRGSRRARDRAWRSAHIGRSGNAGRNRYAWGAGDRAGLRGRRRARGRAGLGRIGGRDHCAEVRLGICAHFGSERFFV